ncbi:hypothetical protein ABVL22_004307 [Salmonella enterica]
MTGYELRIWRRGFGWDQERAAEELGVCLRTYKAYEKSQEVTNVVVLAAQLLTLKSLLPVMKKSKCSKAAAMMMISNIVDPE